MRAGSRATVEAFCAALATGDIDGAVSLFAPEASWWIAGSIPGLSGTRVGADVGVMLLGVLDQTTDSALWIEPRAWTVDSDRVALEAMVTANLPDGVYRNEYHFAFVISSGRITVVRAYLDTERLRMAFGEDRMEGTAQLSSGESPHTE